VWRLAKDGSPGYGDVYAVEPKVLYRGEEAGDLKVARAVEAASLDRRYDVAYVFGPTSAKASEFRPSSSLPSVFAGCAVCGVRNPGAAVSSVAQLARWGSLCLVQSQVAHLRNGLADAEVDSTRLADTAQIIGTTFVGDGRRWAVADSACFGVDDFPSASLGQTW
jgi:hypothetical protein